MMLKYIFPLFLSLFSVVAEAQTCFSPACNTGGFRNAYVGQVATRSGLPSTDDTTNTGVMSRTVHYARSSIVAPQVGVAGLYLSPTAGETTDATETFTGSVEYPAGTFYQLKWSGATSVTSAGTLKVSDAVTGLVLPYGAQFWVRLYETGTHVVYSTLNSSVSFGGFDQTTIGTSTTDQTMSGTVSNGTSYADLQPACIIASTVQPAVLGLGDARIVGYGDSRNDPSADGGETWRWIGPRYAYLDLSVSSATAQSYLSNNTVRKLLGAYTTAAINDLGAADISNNPQTTVSTVTGYRAQATAIFNKPYTFGLTIPPVTTSTDSFVTAANQTISSLESLRTSTNTAIRAGVASEVAVIDTDRMIDPAATGLWPVNGTTYAYTINGSHESSLSAILERNSSLWSVFNIH